ncbi:hypothetical protein BGZ60DRAFT_528261 [Tricladium varicosporioides]|nr:hypothetical protein BGZ60DRAFT_528261 [Hymenoscyphus varicosporioides]
MKLNSITSLALCAIVAICQESVDVTSIFSFYYSSYPPFLPPAASTSLASLLQSVDKSWHGSPYIKNVPTELQTAVRSYLTAWYSVEAEILSMTSGLLASNTPDTRTSATSKTISTKSAIPANTAGSTTAASATSTAGAVVTRVPMVAELVGLAGGILAAL